MSLCDLYMSFYFYFLINNLNGRSCQPNIQQPSDLKNKNAHTFETKCAPDISIFVLIFLFEDVLIVLHSGFYWNVICLFFFSPKT